jgi:hypothetical protein
LNVNSVTIGDIHGSRHDYAVNATEACLCKPSLNLLMRPVVRILNFLQPSTTNLGQHWKAGNRFKESLCVSSAFDSFIKKGISMYLRAIGTLLVMMQFVFSTDAAVTGRVVDGAGKAVADAMITYTNPANRLVYVYTNGLGQFAIPAPADWNLKDPPMYLDPTAILTPHNAGYSLNNVNAFGISLAGDVLKYSVQGTKNITIDLYGCNGRKISTLFSGRCTEGRYQMNISASMP